MSKMFKVDILRFLKATLPFPGKQLITMLFFVFAAPTGSNQRPQKTLN